MPAWEDPRRVLRRHGLAPKRGYSQSFLVAPHAVERIADALDPRPDELTVELGPGLGTLTGALLRKGARVIAIERDPDMIAVLAAELGHVERLEVREGDAASVDLAALAGGARIGLAGNLPYAITGAILRNLVASRAALRRAVIMVQREVRDRLVATPGTRAWGAPSVFLQAAFEVSDVIRVPAGAFHPPPRVDSAVVALDPREVPRAEETEGFRALVKAVFGQRRKTLRNALASLGGDPDAALAAAGYDPRRRGETLDIEELAALARAWEATR
ncbi:MAG: ribosomal RNA small subunit methyltransferase A [Sandaracinaceae bacterium]|nr:ribosomal RNA small subunit methyltransferase A [Sandaracinaceae bacterium]